MPWKLKPAEYIQNYAAELKFYKVTIPVAYYGKVSPEYAMYKKWAWKSCGDTWAMTAPLPGPWGADPHSFFYIGFKSGEDKMGFRLAHDPQPLTILEKSLKVFVRIWDDK